MYEYSEKKKSTTTATTEELKTVTAVIFIHVYWLVEKT